MSVTVGFIHASLAAVEPVTRFFRKKAPALEPVNLLDDGLLRLLASADENKALERFHEMIRAAREAHGARLVLLTCSAVPRGMLDDLRASAGIPVLKIDEPLARAAVETGKSLGILVTFPAALETTRRLLLDVAAKLGRTVELVPEVVPHAYEALLAGEPEKHDALVLEAIHGLASRNVDAIVLAQVSMARVLDRVEAQVSIPVLSSLQSSLEAVSRLLEERE